MIEQRLIGEADAAKLIGMSRIFLRRARCEGAREGRTPGPPWIKHGRAVSYYVDDLSGWSATHRMGAEVPQS